MRFHPLSAEQKEYLELRHRYEGDKRVADRIKAVLLKNEGWKNKAIAQALRIHEETVRYYITDWTSDEKLKPENGGSYSKLDRIQSHVLEHHLEETTYTRVIDICAYIESTFGVRYTVSGLTKWLHQHRFSYKQPKTVPAKADLAKQEEFVEKYIELIAETPTEEPILFMDSSHPTMATKVVCGWIKKGVDKPIVQTASRTRVNVMGAIELTSMKVVSWRPDYVNAETTGAFFDQLKVAYPTAPNIHIILDQSGYHRSLLVREEALKRNIVLHYLPPYSPNLNPIERLWKVMNEEVRNNVFFSSAKHFRDAIADFFELWHQYKQECFSRWELIRKTQFIRYKVGELLEQGTYTDPKLRIVRFCSNLLTQFDALWTFIFNENIEPTNNHAEQCLRPAVIWRKNYFGTRSDYGSDFIARTMSLITSCRLQAKSAFDVFTQILIDHFSGQKSLVFANPT